MTQAGLSLVNPGAMWALLSLLIPLLIHLFNRSRGRLVKIGHIDLVRRAKQLQVTEVRLSQWLLLATRLGIFALLALLLAGLSSSTITTRQHTAIYLSPAWLENATQQDLNGILERSKAEPGSTIQLLAPGFPAIDEGWLAGHETPSFESTNIWPLLLEKLESENHAGPVEVHATDFAGQFGRHRPALPRPVNWKLSHPATPSMTNSQPYHAVVVYQSDRIAELKRLENVFTVIKEYRLPALTWESVASDSFSFPCADCDWLIRMVNETSDEEWRDEWPAEWPGPGQTPLVVLTIAGQASNERDFEYIDVPFYPWSRFGLQQISEPADGLTQHEHGNEWQVLVKTGQHEPLLQQQRIGNTRLIQFNSRLDPAWNSLVQQAEFPELFLQLLLDEDREMERFAEARISVDALQGHHAPPPFETRAEKQALHRWLALSLVLLWILERWLSERRPRASR